MISGNKRKSAFSRTLIERSEIRQRSRNIKRKLKGLTPLVTPLTIVPKEEWARLLKENKMAFISGNERIELPLIKFGMSLQGVFSHPNGNIYSFRLYPKRGLDQGIWLQKVIKKSDGTYNEIASGGSFAIGEDTAHMLIPTNVRGSGIGVKAASLAERDIRARQGGTHELSTFRFQRLYEKLGYTKVGVNGLRVVMKKTRRVNEKDNLLKFHSIEAIDPRTRKVRVFNFPIPQEK